LRDHRHLVHQVRYRDQRHDRGRLEERDELVDRLRQHAPHHLRQNQAAQDHELGHSAGPAGLEMSERDRLDSGAERLGEIAAVDESERDHGREEGRKLEAAPDQRPEQQRQDEMHPHHHDVVGRIPEHLDVERADPAKRPRPVDPQERGDQTHGEGHCRRAEEHVGVERQAAQQDLPVLPEQR